MHLPNFLDPPFLLPFATAHRYFFRCEKSFANGIWPLPFTLCFRALQKTTPKCVWISTKARTTISVDFPNTKTSSAGKQISD